MDLKKLSKIQDFVRPSKGAKSYEELRDKWVNTVIENDDNADPYFDGTLLMSPRFGDELGFVVMGYGWESNEISKYQKLAKRLGVPTTFKSGSDLVVLNPSVAKWMDETYNKLQKMVDDLEYIGTTKSKISESEFEKFVDYSKITGYHSYEDVDYTIVKRYLK